MHNLVLLHGWGADPNIWNDLIPSLTPNFDVIALDLSLWCNLEEMGTQVLAQTPKNAIYLGWSLGGLLALQIAIQAPERAHKLITVATTPKFIATKNWEAMPAETFNDFYQMFEINHIRALNYFISLQFLGSPNYKKLITITKKNLAKQSKQDLANGLQLLRDTDLRNEINKIKCPTLHIYGANDQIVPEVTAQQLANTKIIKNASHAVFLDQQKTFLQLLHKFANE